jgi:hypothetical protein
VSSFVWPRAPGSCLALLSAPLSSSLCLEKERYVSAAPNREEVPGTVEREIENFKRCGQQRGLAWSVLVSSRAGLALAQLSASLLKGFTVS